MVPKTRFKNVLVWLQLVGDDQSFKARIKRMCVEGDSWAYLVEHENGDIEPIFVNSIFRIYPVNPRKAKVINIRKKLRLIKNII